MPRYIYHCDNCDTTFQVTHSINELLTDCDNCNQKETLTRVPSMVNVEMKIGQKPKAGKITRDFIEEAKKELKEQKKQTKKEEIKS